MRLKNHPEKWLRDDAAASINRIEDDHGIISINSAGRTTADQQGLINRWYRGGPANRPPNLYKPQEPASASNHVRNGGVAVDTSHITFMLKYGGAYGWTRPYSGDPVHFEYNPNNDRHRNRKPPAKPAGNKLTPIIPVRKPRMYSFVPDAKSDTIYACSLVNGKRVGIRSITDYSLLRRFRDNEGADKMLVVEMDIVLSYLKQLA